MARVKVADLGDIGRLRMRMLNTDASYDYRVTLQLLKPTTDPAWFDEAHAAGIKIGICGQAPSNHPEIAQFLVERGIDSISLNPDSVIDTWQQLAQR